MALLRHRAASLCLEGRQAESETRKMLCPDCRVERTFERPAIRHSLHATVSVMTGGAWLVVWAALLISQHYCEPWKCPMCRTLRN